MSAAVDLFGHREAAPMRLRLARSVDQARPCHSNVATVTRTTGLHAAESRCTICGKHRGWLPRCALEILTTTAARFGAPEPLTLTDRTIGDHQMQKATYDNKNSGALFKNERKEKDTDRDYSGTVNVEGREYWLSGWIKTSKAGNKFVSLALKPKDAAASVTTKPAGAPFDDAIGF